MVSFLPSKMLVSDIVIGIFTLLRNLYLCLGLGRQLISVLNCSTELLLMKSSQ